VNARHGYACLDGVRGWAALMVACSHFVFAMHPALLGAGEAHAHFPGAAWLGRTGAIVLYNPQFAVDIFFVLSGFVLATSVNNRPAPLVELVLRRWLRLGLPILATTALIWPLVNNHLFWPSTAGALAKSDWLTLMYATPAGADYAYMTLPRLFAGSLVGIFVPELLPMPFYNPALWTMKMEFWGSVGLFAGYTLLPAAWAARGAGLLAALIAIGFTWQVPLLAPFCFGIALFELRRLAGPRAAVPRPAAGVALLALGVLLGGMPYDMRLEPYASLFRLGAPWVGSVSLLSFRVGALCVVAAVLAWPPLQRLLLGRVSQWLGRVSFALYLVHVPILCSLGAWLLLRLEPALGYNAATLAVLPAFLAAALTVAALAARWIDEPSIRLAKRFGGAVLPTLRRPLAPYPTP